MPKTVRPPPSTAAPNAGGLLISARQAVKMTQTELTANQMRDTQAKVIAALAEVRKARHHRDCYCRSFERASCNANTAFWERALQRELGKLADHYRRNNRRTTT
jgi:hypothetical protein